MHTVYRRWREILDSYPSDGFPGARTAVGEVWADSAATLKAYLADDELPQIFNFDLVRAKWSPTAVRAAIETTHAFADGSRAPWVIGNHDVVRPVTRWGVDAARAAALLLLALPGSAYIYQGEELGLPGGRGHPRRRPTRSDLPPDRGEGGRPRRLPDPASLVSGRCFIRIFPNGPWL